MSTHLYYAEKQDITNIFNLLVDYKNTDLIDIYPDEVDTKKGMHFINTILQKGKILLVNDLDKDELIACCMFHKSEYFFSR